VLKEATDILGEQAALSIETMRFNVLKAGTNVFYSGGTSRATVDEVCTIKVLRLVTRALKKQHARPITNIIRSTPSYGTTNIPPSFIAVGHTDLEADIRIQGGFLDVKDYGSVSPFEMEIGTISHFRFLLTPVFEPWLDSGAAKGSTLGTTYSDVYPVLVFGRDAYAITALKGKYSITPTVINPTPSKSDPLGQRGSVAWKTMQGCVILNDLWMARIECAATAAPAS
jgi:N4-gp56 family major capsid protein